MKPINVSFDMPPCLKGPRNAPRKTRTIMTSLNKMLPRQTEQDHKACRPAHPLRLSHNFEQRKKHKNDTVAPYAIESGSIPLSLDHQILRAPYLLTTSACSRHNSTSPSQICHSMRKGVAVHCTPISTGTVSEELYIAVCALCLDMQIANMQWMPLGNKPHTRSSATQQRF